MADKWVTWKPCPKCEINGKKQMCSGQYWGKDEANRCEYLLSCEVCGWNMVFKSDYR